MPINNEQTYYNSFDPSDKYFEVRALAGLVEQSREDNEIQAILKYIIKGLGDSIRKDGSLISGEGFNRGTGAQTNELTMPAARFWQGGIVHDVAEKAVTITGTGNESVGIRIVETLVTPSNDPDLKDPAVGMANYGQPGANRLKIEAVWEVEANVTNGDAFFALYPFADGVLQSKPKVGEIEAIQKQLARRTYDESGNYVVAGFNMKAKAGSDPKKIGVEIGNTRDTQYAGSKAYIQGGEVIKLTAETKEIDRALTTRPVTDERFFYYPVDHTAPTDAELQFELPSQPAAKINKVSVTFDVVRTVSSHNFNGYDELIQTGETLQEVLKVYKGGTPEGGNTTVYTNAGSVNGVGDYYKFGNGIRWDVAGSSSEPTSGDTYQVYMTVRRSLLPSERILTALNGDPNRMALDLTPLRANGTLPYTKDRTKTAPNDRVSSDIDVDYEFYLSRIDVIYVDEQGSYGVSAGQPDVKPQVPFSPSAVLSLGHVLLPAGADFDRAQITAYQVKRLTMLELRKLLERVERTEYNAAATNLNNEGIQRAGNSITSLRGILTEAFTYTHDDIEDDGVGGISRIKFVKELTSKHVFNVQNAELSVPEIQQTHRSVGVASAANVNIAVDVGQAALRTLSLGYDLNTNPLIAQMQATTTIAVNQYDNAPKPLTLQADQTEFYMAKEDSFDIFTINPTSFQEFVARVSADRNALQDPATLQKLKGATEGNRAIQTFVSKDWLWVYAAGWNANSQIKLLIDGRAPRLTGNPSVVGRAYSITGAVTLPAGNAEIEACIDKAALSAALEDAPNLIYAAGTPVRTNTKGEFFVGIEIPAGVPSGTFLVTATDEDFRTASTMLKGNAQLAVRDATASLVEGLSAIVAPVAPKISGVTVHGGGMSAGSDRSVVNGGAAALASPANLTATTHVQIKISWDKSGGNPELVTLVHTPVNGSQTAKQVQIVNLNRGSSDVIEAQRMKILDQGFIVLTIPSVSQAFEFQATVSNIAAAVNYQSEVLYNLTASTTSVAQAEEGALSMTPDTTSVIWGRATGATIRWSGYSSQYTNLKVYVDRNPTPIYNGTPHQSGTGAGSLRASVGQGGHSVTAVFSGPNGVLQARSANSATIYGYDPLAQTFVAPETRFFEGVELFFSEKPTDPNETIFVTVREVVNGYPGDNSRLVKGGFSLKRAEECSTSANATSATYFKFDGLVFMEKGKSYAITIQSASPEFKAYIGRVGGEYIRGPKGETSGTMLSQAGSGVLFDGGNSDTWAPIPNADLMFRLKDVAKFKGAAGAAIPTGTVTFAPIAFSSEMVGLHLDTEMFLPQPATATSTPPCRVKWEYQIPGNSNWYPFEAETYAFFPAVASSVTVRATLSTTEPTLTPLVFSGSLKIAGIKRETTGTYVSKTATFADDYRYVRMIAKQDLPPGVTVKWFVSDNQTAPAPAAYSAAATYNFGDITVFNSVKYMALATTTGQQPDQNPASWELVEVDANDVVWREVTATGETKIPTTDGNFNEHERSVDLGEKSGRKQFRFMLKLTCPAANLHRPPRVRDVICITNN